MTEKKASILIIEDDASARETLQINLEVEGYKVNSAENCTKALAMVKENAYDIMIVDYRLPDMTGIDFIKQASVISKDSVPLIFTGMSTLEIALEGMKIGVHDYLIKPVAFEELKKILISIMAEKAEVVNGKERLAQVVADTPQKEQPFVEKLVYVPVAGKDSGDKVIFDDFSKEASGKPSVIKWIKRFFWDIS